MDTKNWPIFTIALSVLLVIVFIIQQANEGFTESFALYPVRVLSAPYILLTNTFLHASFVHLFFNIIGIWIFCAPLERKTGKEFAAFVFLATGIIGSIGDTLAASDPTGGLIGASGAAFGFIGVVTVIYPKMLLEVPGGPALLILLLEVVYSIGGGNVAHSAHVFGMIPGIVLGLIWKKWKHQP